MGSQSFLFKWDHPAKEVYVTGTFDDWSKSIQLVKRGLSWENNVDLPKAEKVYYKVRLLALVLHPYDSPKQLSAICFSRDYDLCTSQAHALA